MQNSSIVALSAPEAEQFDRDGYLMVRNALSNDEVKRLLAVVEQLRVETASASDGAVFNAFNVVERDDAFVDLMDHPSVIGRVAGLIGATALLLMSQVMVRPPVPHQALGWHHDGPKPYPFAGIDGRAPLLNLKIGWFLTDLSDDYLGNLMVVPGSHRFGVLPDAGVLEHSARETTELGGEMPGAIQVHAAPGDAILFHNGLWHAVAASKANRSRTVLYYAYGPPWLRLQDRDAPTDALVARCGAVRKQLLGGLSSAHDHGGMHPGASGAPLLGLIEDRSYDEVMVGHFRRELAQYRAQVR
jgi:ectoine hydroxylase